MPETFSKQNGSRHSIDETFDVVVVGGGLAGICAAISCTGILPVLRSDRHYSLFCSEPLRTDPVDGLYLVHNQVDRRKAP